MNELGPGAEFDLIRRLTASGLPLPAGVRMGPGDDCAVLDGGVVVSTDLSVEGVHFRLDWITLEEAGYRAAAAALSDLAAMASKPLGVLLSLALPPGEAGGKSPGAMALQTGVREACRREGAAILGGDLSSSPGPVVMDIVVVGLADPPLFRSGGLQGDELWVTGRLGGSAAAVHLWKNGRQPGPELKQAFTSPRPRIREMGWLSERVELRCGIDLSDGLLGDAGHLAAASGVLIEVEAEAIPLHPALVEAIPDPDHCLHFALQGGEDYEVCFSAPPGSVQGVISDFVETFGIPLTRIGGLYGGTGVRVTDLQGRPLRLKGGFSHFQEKELG